MATLSNNDIATAIYLDLKDKSTADMPGALKQVTKFLARKRLLSKSRSILESLERIINKEEGRIIAKVVTASELDNPTKKDLIHAISTKYKVKEVVIEEKVDERVLGGLKIQIEDEVIDFTLKNKIKKLEEHLTR